MRRPSSPHALTALIYFAGEVLDLNGPSGGFNLQICWSTGYAAGRAGHHH